MPASSNRASVDRVALEREVHRAEHPSRLGPPAVHEAARGAEEVDLLHHHPGRDLPGAEHVERQRRARDAEQVDAGRALPTGSVRQTTVHHVRGHELADGHRGVRIPEPRGPVSMNGSVPCRLTRSEPTTAEVRRAPAATAGPPRFPHPRERRLVRRLDDGVAEGASEPVLLALHLDAEEAFEDGVDPLTLAIAPHRLVDPRIRGEQPLAERVHDVVAVPLGRGHERLDATELQPLLVVEDGPEQPFVAREHLLHRSGVRRVERREPLLQTLDVEAQRRHEVVHELPEAGERPRPGELEPVGHLVDRDPRPEVGRVEAPVAFERRDVRDHEQQRPRALGSRDRDVVLAEDLLGERAEDAADLRPEQQRRELAEELRDAHLRLLGHRLALGGRERLPQPGRGRLEDAAQALDVRLDPSPSPDGLHVRQVVRRVEGREVGHLQLGDADDVLEGRAGPRRSAPDRRSPSRRSRSRPGARAPS